MESAAQETTQSEQDGGGGTLKLVNQSMTTLDPQKASDTASGEVTTQLYDGLLNFPQGEFVPDSLALEAVDDYTLRMEPNSGSRSRRSRPC